jgi:hypothetical protein
MEQELDVLHYSVYPGLDSSTLFIKAVDNYLLYKKYPGVEQKLWEMTPAPFAHYLPCYSIDSRNLDAIQNLCDTLDILLLRNNYF